MKPIDPGKMSFEELYLRLRDDDDFVAKHSANRPLHSLVSYMLASLIPDGLRKFVRVRPSSMVTTRYKER